MSPSASLEVLPPELQHGILERVADTKTLRALIQASPSFFQVYRHSKKAIMSQMTHNQMDPTYLHIAFDVYYLRETKLDIATYRSGTEYLNDSGRKSHLGGPCSFPLKTSQALLSFHETVEYFISDFTQSRLSIMKRCLDFTNTQEHSHGLATEPEIPPVLSEIEHCRLTRAFYYFELFACLFSMKEGPRDVTTGKRTLGIYLAQMNVWELEEFFCVWSYFKEKRMDYVDQIEYDILQEHIKKCCSENASCEHFSITAGILYSNPNSDFKRVMHLDRSLALGLKTIKRILNEDALQDASISTKNGYSLEIPWILEMNWMATYRPRRLPSTMPWDFDSQDDIDKPSAGLRWATKGLEDPKFSDAEMAEIVRSGLRRWGYAIWDHQRLEKLRILSQHAVYVSKLSAKDLKTSFQPQARKEMTSAP